jgi:hypothetical protein
VYKRQTDDLPHLKRHSYFDATNNYCDVEIDIEEDIIKFSLLARTDTRAFKDKIVVALKYIDETAVKGHVDIGIGMIRRNSYWRCDKNG